MNYEDPNYNISIPVFSIHGNHDDPAGVRHCLFSKLNFCEFINPLTFENNVYRLACWWHAGNTHFSHFWD